ncbi:DUF445 domain-containing protein [Metaclostridioides mangenotii]|uniref:Uncharacterized membrane protein YheB (UPF0754 family) n=1 Tax=Metaclostridioides mangenotii TaxID=1540 RepID=A0ABS4EDE1_9FIRM|nr:DUF445 family protein [Clostridioides mangenotii]MBP1855959.1 uncharacterized membrane protein YheB (UPF0754 family) [Clostridioides mangenotii]
MDNLIKILILASIGGVIGYITNVVAIRLIFRPIKAIKIPILNIEIIGLIPKRREEIATNIAKIVEEEFISLDEILDNVITEDDKDEVVIYIKSRISVLLNEKISYVPSGIKKLIEGYLNDMVEEEVKNSIDDLSKGMMAKASERINIQEMIEGKINELDLLVLEDLIISVAKKELKHIEFLGLVLGFLIGIVQGLIVVFM